MANLFGQNVKYDNSVTVLLLRCMAALRSLWNSKQVVARWHSSGSSWWRSGDVPLVWTASCRLRDAYLRHGPAGRRAPHAGRNGRHCELYQPLDGSFFCRLNACNMDIDTPTVTTVQTSYNSAAKSHYPTCYLCHVRLSLVMFHMLISSPPWIHHKAFPILVPYLPHNTVP